MNEFIEGGSQQVTYSSDEVIDLQEYWFIFRQNLYGIFAFTCIASAIAILVIFSIRPTYQGIATLLIETNEPKAVTVESVSVTAGAKSLYFATQFEILKSRELAEQVIKRNRKQFQEEIQRDTAGESGGLFDFIRTGKKAREGAFFTQALTGKLNITPVKGTQLVRISYESPNPRFAAAIANGIANAYIENNLESRAQMTQQTTAWLAAKSDSLRIKLLESEQKLQAYRESEDLVDNVSRGAKTIATTELEVAATKLVEVRQKRIQAENIAAQIANLPDRKAETLGSIPAVLQHNLVQRLKEQEAAAEQKLSELSDRYGEKHPKIIAAKSELDAARRNVDDQILKVVEGINKEAEVARATEKALDRQMQELKKKIQLTKRKEYRLDELERDLTVNRQMYETFLGRFKETSEGADMVTANSRIIDHAVEPTKATGPNRTLLSIIAVLLSFVMGVIVTFIKEAIDSTVRSKDDVVFKLHLQLLGVLPLLRGKKNASEFSLEYTNNRSGSFAESIRTMRTGVVLSGLDNPHKILMVTSSIPGEGKTTIASNLAAAFGQMEKTLLIDADMRRPSIAKNFGIKTTDPGLSNLVAEMAELDQCIHRIDNLGFAILPAGTLPPNPLELLSSKRFTAVLAELEKSYDRIIIDTAPCEVVSDALILSTIANAVIYVVKADETNIRIVKSGISRLREVKAPITGVVLNQVDINKKTKHNGYGQYYGGYYDHYGYSRAPADKET